MTAHSLFLVLFLAAAVAPVAAQTAEPTVWDKYTENCSTASPAGATIINVTQRGTSEVEVFVSGYSDFPKLMWLTDQAGTIITYTDDDGILNLASGPHLTFDSATLSDQPTRIQAHTCPPSTGSVQAATVKTWRGIYDDATNNCCSDTPITAQEIIDYGPTITVVPGCCADGTWGKQQFKYTATKKSALLYVQDSAGRIIHLQEHTAGEVAADPPSSYDSGYLTIPAGSTSLRACALLTTGDTADQRNPICTDMSFVRIASQPPARSAPAPPPPAIPCGAPCACPSDSLAPSGMITPRPRASRPASQPHLINPTSHPHARRSLGFLLSCCGPVPCRRPRSPSISKFRRITQRRILTSGSST